MPIPERLTLSGSGEWVLDEDGVVVASLDGVHHTAGENLAVARRVAAAWNALRHIPTEAIEAVADQPDDLARMNALARVPFPVGAGPEAGGKETST